MLRKLIEKVMFFIISPLFLLFFGYPPPPPTFKIDLCTTNLSNKFLSQENLWLWTFYNRQFANVNKKIWCMCNDSNKSLPLSCQLFVYTKITQLITQIFCLLWNLHCQKNLRKEYESKKNYPLYENLLSLATKRKYIQTVLQPYYTTRNHLCNNVNKQLYLFTFKKWCNKKNAAEK